MKKYMLICASLLVFIQLQAQDKNIDPPVVEPMKPALVVIDIQNAFMKYMAPEGQELALEIINGTIWYARKYNVPVIRVYHTSKGYGPEPGTEPFEFPKSVIIKDTDTKVIKNFPNAFTKTDLDSILREMGCNTLFLCGLSATGCVLATYFGAVDHDYKVFMVRGSLLSPQVEYTRSVESFCESVSLETYGFMLEKVQGGTVK